MGRFEGAAKELHKKLKVIFESNQFTNELKEGEDVNEFTFTGDVTYNIKVEKDEEHTEYYVMDQDGNIIEIFTDAMVDQDGKVPAAVRQAIVTQAGGEVESTDDDETEEVEDEDDVEDSIPDGGSVETPTLPDESAPAEISEKMPTEELPESVKRGKK